MAIKRSGFALVCIATVACAGSEVVGGGGDTYDAGADAAPPPPPRRDAATPLIDSPVETPDTGPRTDTSLPDGELDANDAGVQLTQPPPMPAYSHGTCPKLVTGPTDATSLNSGFPSGTATRDFHVVVPAAYDGSQPWPVVFGYHWLNASASSLISAGEVESATEQLHFIAVVPNHRTDANGNKVYQLDWPFVEVWGVPDELLFFDDMLACVSQELNVDARRVYAMGASAGALWATYLSTTDRVQHLAAVESLSGGLGQVGPWSMQYVPQPNKFPALVLWGGPSDWLVVDFAAASKKYRDALRQDNHFVVECTHDAGHAMPPIPIPPDGGTRLAPLWQFMLDHPYGLPPNTSPYQDGGLPSVYPSWCQIAP